MHNYNERLVTIYTTNIGYGPNTLQWIGATGDGHVFKSRLVRGETRGPVGRGDITPTFLRVTGT